MLELAGPLSHNFVSFEDAQGYVNLDGVTPIIPCGLRLRTDRLSEYDFNRVIEPNSDLFCHRCVRYDCPDHFNFQVIPHGAIQPIVPVPFAVANCKKGNIASNMPYQYILPT